MDIVHILKQGLWLIVILSTPGLIVAVFFGIIISLLQAIMQLQDQTLPFAIKILAVGIVLSLTAGWQGEQIMEFSRLVFNAMSYIHG